MKRKGETVKLTTAPNGIIPDSAALLSPLGDDVLDGRGVFAGIEQKRVVLVRKDLSKSIDASGKFAAAEHLAPAAGDSELRHARCPDGRQFNSTLGKFRIRLFFGASSYSSTNPGYYMHYFLYLTFDMFSTFQANSVGNFQV